MERGDRRHGRSFGFEEQRWALGAGRRWLAYLLLVGVGVNELSRS